MDGLFINAGGYFLLPFIYGEGGDLVDADAKKIVVNSAENVAGIKIAQDLVEQRRRGQAAGQRLLRHDDDPVQGAARSP